MKYRYYLFIAFIFLFFFVVMYYVVSYNSFTKDVKPGDPIDELNGITIFYNGGINESHGRTQATNLYNIGIKYQCVEFVKRYYFERFGHMMPESFGHAKSFFDPTLQDGVLNIQRDLLQYKNGSSIPPQLDDIVIFNSNWLNPYGHIAIIAEVNKAAVVIAQQNPSIFSSTREAIPIIKRNNRFYILDKRVLGWLRRKN